MSMRSKSCFFLSNDNEGEEGNTNRNHMVVSSQGEINTISKNNDRWRTAY